MLDEHRNVIEAYWAYDWPFAIWLILAIDSNTLDVFSKMSLQLCHIDAGKIHLLNSKNIMQIDGKSDILIKPTGNGIVNKVDNEIIMIVINLCTSLIYAWALLESFCNPKYC